MPAIFKTSLATLAAAFAVATIAGTARFAAGGKTVALPAGTASASQAGGTPEDPEHISEDVFLNVVWPTVDRKGEHAEIKGRATPSSVVTVRGKVQARDGEFVGQRGRGKMLKREPAYFQ